VSPAGLEVSPVARPVIAVLPFAVVTGGDTAQFSRSVALILSEALALRNGVSTVDANQLLGRWIAEQRRVTAPLDSNAGFAYSLGANQMVIGNYVESGRTFRLSAAMYDTRSAAPLWRDEVTGPTDSLFPLVDRLASRAAVALCGQPDYNPSNLCFDTPARTTEPLAVTGRAGAEADPVRMLVHVAPDGTPSDVRIQEAPADEDLTFQALAAVNAARYQPARKAGRAVEAWTEVAVAVRPPGAAADLALTARCDDPAFGVRNADRACFDTRPVPQDRLPVIRVPAVCGGSATPATVLARVSASGTVEGRPQVKAGSSCAAFDDSAASAVAQIGFAPAIKDGRPVPAWTLVLVRPLPDGFGGTE
jgi:TonB family protein